MLAQVPGLPTAPHAAIAAFGARARVAVPFGDPPWDDWLDLTVLHSGDFRLTLGNLLGAVLLLMLAVVVSLLLQRLLRRYAQRYEHVSAASVYAVSRLLHYLLLLVGVMLALGATGIPMARFAVFAGALGVGLGFGLQTVFNNFVCGVVLLFDRSLKVGDFVDLQSGVQGRVRAIHLRATRVTTNDDIDILVPNSEFVNGRVVNWTVREGYRRLKVPFHVAYGSDKELVRRVVLEAASTLSFLLAVDDAHQRQVRLAAFGEWALQFELLVWLDADATRRPGAAAAACNWAIHDALAAHAIRIPLPQRELRFADGPAPARAMGAAQGVTQA